MAYKFYICGGAGEPCGIEGFEKRWFVGIVPVDFDEETGLSATYEQVPTASYGQTGLFEWVQRTEAEAEKAEKPQVSPT